MVNAIHGVGTQAIAAYERGGGSRDVFPKFVPKELARRVDQKSAEVRVRRLLNRL
jgi:hypothetical protein